MTNLETFPPAAAAAASRARHKLLRQPVAGDYALLDGQVVEIVECGPVLVWVRFPDAAEAVAVQRSALDFPDTLQAD